MPPSIVASFALDDGRVAELNEWLAKTGTMADGGIIVLRRHGNPDGPRLVLSHGNGFSADAYLPFWSLLLDRFDVVLYDLRNHGHNPLGDRASHTIPMMVWDNMRIVQEIDRVFESKLIRFKLEGKVVGVAIAHQCAA